MLKFTNLVPADTGMVTLSAPEVWPKGATFAMAEEAMVNVNSAPPVIAPLPAGLHECCLATPGLDHPGSDQQVRGSPAAVLARADFLKSSWHRHPTSDTMAAG